MCRPTTCRRCSKTTWAGCGQHVDQVLRSVPQAARCSCRQDDPGRASDRGSLLSRILGR